MNGWAKKKNGGWRGKNQWIEDRNYPNGTI